MASCAIFANRSPAGSAGGSDATGSSLNPAAPRFLPNGCPLVHVKLTLNPSFYYHLYPPPPPPPPPYYMSAAFTSPLAQPPPMIVSYPVYTHNYHSNPSTHSTIQPLPPPPPLLPPLPQDGRLHPPPSFTTEQNPNSLFPDETHLANEAKTETDRRQDKENGTSRLPSGRKKVFGRRNGRRGDSTGRGRQVGGGGSRPDYGEGDVNMNRHGNIARRKWRERHAFVPVQSDGQMTTVMIRNIPNKYTREMLIEFLDKHCQEENEKEKEKLRNSGSEANEFVCSAYDFLYLPMDFRSGLNKGYAFVNFTDARAVWKFHVAYNNHPWDLFSSKKRLEVASARIQGKDRLVRHFERMTYPVVEYSAVYFSPARSSSGDGTSVVQTVTVGNCTGLTTDR